MQVYRYLDRMFAFQTYLSQRTRPRARSTWMIVRLTLRVKQGQDNVIVYILVAGAGLIQFSSPITVVYFVANFYKIISPVPKKKL